MATVSTIGFTGTTAERFFSRLREAGVRRVIDVRLHNTSQLAGFAKRGDLPYFLREICGAAYVHEPQLAPSEELFAFIKKQGGGWDEYERRYRALVRERRIGETLDRSLFNDAALLCTEPTADQCHRRLAAEELAAAWGDIAIVHL